MIGDAEQARKPISWKRFITFQSLPFLSGLSFPLLRPLKNLTVRLSVEMKIIFGKMEKCLLLSTMGILITSIHYKSKEIKRKKIQQHSVTPRLRSKKPGLQNLGSTKKQPRSI